MSGRIEGMGIPFDATFGGARCHCRCGPRVGLSSPVIRDRGAGSARLLVMATRLAESVANP